MKLQGKTVIKKGVSANQFVEDSGLEVKLPFTATNFRTTGGFSGKIRMKDGTKLAREQITGSFKKRGLFK